MILPLVFCAFCLLHAASAQLVDYDPENYYYRKLTKLLPEPITERPCYPSGEQNVPQYMIGYGSLMQKASKDRTDPNTGESFPIRVYGFSRSWSCKGISVGFSTTYLGVDRDEISTHMNSVAFKIPNAGALASYDKRESFYCRVEVPISMIQLLSRTPSFRNLPRGQYWIYLTKPEAREVPSAEYPVVQSYVDTFLSGCFEIEEKFKLTGFSKECVTTTKDWSENWVNDRIYPRRPFANQPMAGKIDRLLSETVPDEYKSIRIEG